MIDGFEIVDRILENLNAGCGAVIDLFALTQSGRFVPGPVRVVGKVVERLRVGHEPEHAACGVADSGDVVY